MQNIQEKEDLQDAEMRYFDNTKLANTDVTKITRRGCGYRSPAR